MNIFDRHTVSPAAQRVAIEQLLQHSSLARLAANLRQTKEAAEERQTGKIRMVADENGVFVPKHFTLPSNCDEVEIPTACVDLPAGKEKCVVSCFTMGECGVILLKSEVKL